LSSPLVVSTLVFQLKEIPVNDWADQATLFLLIILDLHNVGLEPLWRLFWVFSTPVKIVKLAGWFFFDGSPFGHLSDVHFPVVGETFPRDVSVLPGLLEDDSSSKEDSEDRKKNRLLLSLLS